MSPQSVFGIIIRTVGLLLMIWGIGTAYIFFWQISWGYFIERIFLYGIPFMVVVTYLLRGAPKLMSFAYPDDDAKAEL